MGVVVVVVVVVDIRILGSSLHITPCCSATTVSGMVSYYRSSSGAGGLAIPADGSGSANPSSNHFAQAPTLACLPTWSPVI